MQEYGRAGLESCEISTVYTTGLSKEERGLHLANKSKILQYVNGEKDATMTGHGSIQLEEARPPVTNLSYERNMFRMRWFR